MYVCHRTLPVQMAWNLSVLSALVTIWLRWLGLVDSCNSLDLIKRVNDPPLFLQHAPSTVTSRLGLCSRWCGNTRDCLIFAWRPGLCARVGSTVSENVTATAVYIAKKNVTVPGTYLTFNPSSSRPMSFILDTSLHQVEKHVIQRYVISYFISSRCAMSPLNGTIFMLPQDVIYWMIR